MLGSNALGAWEKDPILQQGIHNPPGMYMLSSEQPSQVQIGFMDFRGQEVCNEGSSQIHTEMLQV